MIDNTIDKNISVNVNDYLAPIVNTNSFNMPKIIAGKVMDVHTDEPLQSATVRILDQNGIPTGIGTTTNGDGGFYLDNVQLENLYNKVEFSYVGYTPQRMSPTAAAGNIYLAKVGDTLGEVVIVAKTMSKHKRELIIFALTVLIATLLMVYITKYMKK